MKQRTSLPRAIAMCLLAFLVTACSQAVTTESAHAAPPRKAAEANAPNILFVIMPDERLAYYTPTDFKNNVSKNGDFEFKLRVADTKFNSVAELKKFVLALE